MKLAQTLILKALEDLNPAKTDLVKGVIIETEHGHSHLVKEFTVDGAIILAQSATGDHRFSVIQRDEVSSFEVALDLDKCREASVEPNVAAVLKHVRGKKLRESAA